MFELLKEATDLEPIDLDIRGMTESEVYAKEAEVQAMAEPETESGSILHEGAGHLRFNTMIGSWGEHLIQLNSQDFDPEYSLVQSLQDKGSPLEDFLPAEQDLLSRTVNPEHLDEVLEQISDRRAWSDNAQNLGGVTKFVTDISAEVLNPLNWVPIMPVANSISRAKRVVQAGLVAGGLAGAEELAIKQVYTDKTITDVIAGTFMGGTVGAGIGAVIKPTALTKLQDAVATDIHKSAESLIKTSVTERVAQVQEGSVGAARLDPYAELTGKMHAQFRGDIDDPTVMQAFNKLIDEELPQMKGVLRPDETVGMGESLQRSANPMSRYIGSKVLEHGEGTGGKIVAEHSADLKADLYFNQIGTKYSLDYIHNSGNFKSAVKKSGKSPGSFDELVYREISDQEIGLDSALSKKEVLEAWEKPVLEHAYKIQNYNQKITSMCKKKGVTEFQDLSPSSQYHMTRQYDAKKFVRLANEFGKDTVTRMIQKAIRTGEGFEAKFSKVEEGMEPPDIDAIALNMAKAVFNRMSNRSIHTGADANILNTSNKKLLLDALRDVELPNAEYQHIKKVLDSAGKDRFANPNKSRINMNMSATEGSMKMTDLLNTDLAAGYMGEIRRWSGRAALAEKGFPDRGVYDNALKNMTEVGKSMDDSTKGIRKTQADFDRLNASWDLIQGIPIDKDISSGARQGMRALRKMASAAKLGKLVVAQTSEMGRAIGAIGVLRSIEGIPALRKIIRNAKTGRLSDTFLRDIEDAGLGRIGDEYFLRHKDFRVEEMHEGAFPGERVLDDANYKLAQYTGFNAVQKMQKRFFARQYAMKLWREIKTDSLNPALAKDLGISPRLQRLFKNEMERHAEEISGFGSRKVTNLNVRKWKPEAREAFITVLHKKSSNAIQKINIGDVPLWAHKSIGQFFLQFRSFGLASAGKHGVHDYRMLKSGNTEGINAFLYSASLATALYTAKTNVESFALNKRKRKKFLKNRLNSKAIAKGSVNWMGQLGLSTDIASMLLSGLSPGILGDDISHARTGDVGDALSSIPGIGYLGDAVRGGTGAFRAATSDYEFSSSDFKALWGTIPMNNAFGISNLRNFIDTKYFE